MKYIVLLFSMMFYLNLLAQSAHKSLRNGDMLYGFGKYQEAETEYRRADNEKASVKSAYNLGNALIQQERYEEAAKKYNDAAAKANTDAERANIYYNQGNALFNKQQYQESINAYKKSLKYDSKDVATKENLAMARQQLRQQQQQQQQQNKDNKQNQDKNKDESQQDQQNKDQNSKDDQEQKDQDQQQNKDNQNNDQNNQNEKPDGKEMSKSDAQKLLEIMDNEEKKVQQKMRRVDGKGKKVVKDW
jgi:tetratricopeptide (TPR) repeat protein